MNQYKHSHRKTLTALLTLCLLGSLPLANATTPTKVQTIDAAKTTQKDINKDSNILKEHTVTDSNESTVTNFNHQQSINNQIKAFDTTRQSIFKDVPADYWAANSISVMTQKKVISGYSDGTFKPEKPLTREEAAALFNNLIGDTPSVMLSSSFSDITSDRWSALAIESVAKKNLINGYGDGTYRPEKYISRQEFAVVADKYLHYLGYTTDDPTVLDSYAYADQKFVASWAQDAVRELASLNFLAYNPRTMFNGEKYITRAEATEISWRMTSSKQAVDFLNNLHHQIVEKKASDLIQKTLKYKDVSMDFRKDGAMFWNNDTLVITMKDSQKLKKLASAMAMNKDKELSNYAVVHAGKYTQEDLDALQTDATAFYNKLEPQGTVLSIAPDIAATSLTLTVDQLSDESKKAFTKQFTNKAAIQLPVQESTSWAQPLRVNMINSLKK